MIYKKSTYKWIPKGRGVFSVGFPWTRSLLAKSISKSRVAARTGRIPLAGKKIPVSKPVGKLAKNVTQKAAKETDVGAVYLGLQPLSFISPIPGAAEGLTATYAYGVKPAMKSISKRFKSFA